jgi:urocanate hydratase
MYGQMTAGSWIYIGTQGIVQGTFETFAECARQRFGGSLAGRLVVTAGLGGMGGAQPLAVTLNGGVCLAVEVDPSRLDRRVALGYCDERSDSLDDALARVDAALATKRALSIGLLGNAADVMPELVRRGRIPDAATDQTSAHDPLGGYVPPGLTLAQAEALRVADPKAYVQRSRAAMAVHVEALATFQARGATVFDYGNNLRAKPSRAGSTQRAFSYPASCPRSSGRCSARGRGRSAGPRSRGSRGHPCHRPRSARTVPGRLGAPALAAARRGEGAVPGPARAHLLARLRRARQGRACSTAGARAASRRRS